MKNIERVSRCAVACFFVMFISYFDLNMLSSSKWDTLFYGLCEYQCLRSIDVAIMSITFLLGLFFMCMSWKRHKWKWTYILLLTFIVAFISYIILSAVVASIIFAL